MVVGERDLQALYASVSKKMQTDHMRSSSSNNLSSFASMAPRTQSCPCLEQRQSITRTSSLICTCDPMAPRQITVSPSVSTGHFSYQRPAKFGTAGLPAMPTSTGSGGLATAVSPVSAAASQQDMDMDIMVMDTEMMSSDNDTNNNASETSTIVDVFSDHGPDVAAQKRSIDGTQFSFRPVKRARNDGAPSAVTLLSSQTPMPAEQREELTRLLQHQDAHGEPLSYGGIVQHFAQRGIWLGSDAKTWLLRVLGHS